jgi:hypothetical protein
VLPLHEGDAAVIAVHHRPVQGARGTYRVNLRHGVSRVRSGHLTPPASFFTTRLGLALRVRTSSDQRARNRVPAERMRFMLRIRTRPS